MTEDEAATLEQEFGIQFPRVYRDAIISAYPFSKATWELDREAASSEQANIGCRTEKPWGFPWKPHYWMIGEDGRGGFYFIDTRKDDSTVYYCDHEDMPADIDDLERLVVMTFPEFIAEVREYEQAATERVEKKKARIAQRKWWQFWIPKQ